MAKKKKHKISNPYLAAGLAAIAFGNAWGTHADRRTKRNRSRQEKNRKAIKDFE